MADALSDNFCSLCGLSFYRFGSDNLNIKTSLASDDVENSGEFHSIDYKLSHLFYFLYELTNILMLTPAQCHLLMTCGYICPGIYSRQYAEKGKMEVKMGMMKENTLCDSRSRFSICSLTSTFISLKRMH